MQHQRKEKLWGNQIPDQKKEDQAVTRKCMNNLLTNKTPDQLKEEQAAKICKQIVHTNQIKKKHVLLGIPTFFV